MKLRLLALLCASLLIAVTAYAQAYCLAGRATWLGSDQPPRRVPEPHQEVIPPSPGDLTVWPRGDSPQEIGKALAEHFFTAHARQRSPAIPMSAPSYGALTFAAAHPRRRAARPARSRKFDPMLPGGAEQPHCRSATTWTTPSSASSRSRSPSRPRACRPTTPSISQLGFPGPTASGGRCRRTPLPSCPQDVHDALVKDGLSPETRLWVDDMYMLTMLQLEAYRATGDRKYLDRDAHEMVAYLDRLQQPNGLFYHAPDVQVLLGPRRWLVRRRHGRDAAHPARRSPRPPAHHGRLQADDGRAAEVPGRGRHVARADRPPRGVAGELQLRHVQLRAHHRRQARLARRRHLRPRSPPQAGSPSSATSTRTTTSPRSAPARASWTACSTTSTASAKPETSTARRRSCGPPPHCCATANSAPPNRRDRDHMVASPTVL